MPSLNKKIPIWWIYIGEGKGRGQTSQKIMLSCTPKGPTQAWQCLQAGDFLPKKEAPVSTWFRVSLTFIIYKRMIISNNIHTHFKTKIVNVTLCRPYLDVMPADIWEMARILEIKPPTTPYSAQLCSVGTGQPPKKQYDFSKINGVLVPWMCPLISNKMLYT